MRIFDEISIEISRCNGFVRLFVENEHNVSNWNG